MNTRYRQRFPCANRGVSLLIVIVILGAALLIISTSALLTGLSERESGYTRGRGGEARALADGCMDEAYIRIRRNAAWGASGPVLFTAPNGSCTLLVSDLGAGVREIDVNAARAEYTAHIRSRYSIADAIPVIASWEERGD